MLSMLCIINCIIFVYIEPHQEWARAAHSADLLEFTSKKCLIGRTLHTQKSIGKKNYS